MPVQLTFRKSGKEIKEAVGNRLEQLRQRLEKRNQDLSRFMQDPKKVRSYLVRSTALEWQGHQMGEAPLYSREEISSEEKEEVRQLCRRIFEIEQEVHQLSLLRAHLDDKQEFDLPFHDLVGYGFDSNLSIES